MKRATGASVFKRYAWPLAGAGGLALFFLLLAAPGGGGLEPGAPAPPFELTDLGGRPVTLADYRGKVLLLDFWATWCHTCKSEVPALKELHRKFSGPRFALLAASVDEGAPDAVARFAAENALPYTVAFASEQTARDYRVFGLPTKYLIDARGRIHRRYLLETTPGELERDVASLLDKENS